MLHLIMGISLIAIAAVLGFYGTQLARDGWTELSSPATTAIETPATSNNPKQLPIQESHGPNSPNITNLGANQSMSNSPGGIQAGRDVIIKPTPRAPARPRILFVETRLIPPANDNEPLRISFGLMNHGDADGTVTLKDRTFYFTTDPTQKRFKYLPAPPVEVRVAAVPNAIWRGEMGFDFRLTTEKLTALTAGAARLFFFARGEYRDESGKTYPLPFAEMYDPHFSGNLIACPNDVIFE